MYKITRLRTSLLIELAAKSRLGCFSSYLVEHFLGNGKKEITFVKKEKHEEVGKDDHHARK